MWIFRIISVLLLCFTLLPLARTGFWFVRGWDFPRMQMTVLLVVMVSIAGILLLYSSHATQNLDQIRSNHRRELIVWVLLLATACVWQGSHIIKFTPIYPAEIASRSESDASFDVMIINLKFDNSNYDEVAEKISENPPAVLILIEINQEWREGLDSVRQTFDDHHEEIRDEGLGLAIWSKLPIEDAETKFVVEDIRPSLWANLTFEGNRLNLIAVHPTPPGLDDQTGESRRDSRARDAELILIAKHIAENDDENWIVAGDFNDVAWSHTTRLFKRVSGLRDPRVGRMFLGTFHSEYPLLRFPIDHIFLSDGFKIGELSRIQIAGSDHFGVVSEVSLSDANAGVTPEPKGDDQQDANELINEGKQDAQKREQHE